MVKYIENDKDLLDKFNKWIVENDNIIFYYINDDKEKNFLHKDIFKVLKNTRFLLNNQNMFMNGRTNLNIKKEHIKNKIRHLHKINEELKKGAILYINETKTDLNKVMNILSSNEDSNTYTLYDIIFNNVIVIYELILMLNGIYRYSVFISCDLKFEKVSYYDIFQINFFNSICDIQDYREDYFYDFHYKNYCYNCYYSNYNSGNILNNECSLYKIKTIWHKESFNNFYDMNYITHKEKRFLDISCSKSETFNPYRFIETHQDLIPYLENPTKQDILSLSMFVIKEAVKFKNTSQYRLDYNHDTKNRNDLISKLLRDLFDMDNSLIDKPLHEQSRLRFSTIGLYDGSTIKGLEFNSKHIDKQNICIFNDYEETRYESIKINLLKNLETHNHRDILIPFLPKK